MTNNYYLFAIDEVFDILCPGLFIQIYMEAYANKSNSGLF